MRFEPAVLAARAGIAGDRESQIGEHRRRKVALLIDVDEVGVGFVGAGDRAAHTVHREVGQDAEL